MHSITKIQELEVSALAELRSASLADGYKFIERLCDEWTSGANRFDAPGEALFIAATHGQAVGICGLNRDPYANQPGIGRVRRLYVLKTHRRSGIGVDLVEAVVSHARGHFTLLRLRSEDAGEFYVARGFRSVTGDAETTHVLDLLPSAPTGHQG